MKNVIAADVGVALGISKVEAAAVLKMLVKVGMASLSGVRKTSGRGRSTPVYGVGESITLDLSNVSVVSGEISPVTAKAPKKAKATAEAEKSENTEVTAAIA